MGKISELYSGAQNFGADLARRSDVDNGYSGWKRTAWLSLGVVLAILGLAGVGWLISGIVVAGFMACGTLTNVKPIVVVSLFTSSLGAIGILPIWGAGEILIPAIGYHFKKVIHESPGDRL